MLNDPRHFIVMHRQDDLCCIKLRRRRLDETQVLEFADDILDLIDNQGVRRLVLSLGPEEPLCLYSVFLAKLVTIRKNLIERGGGLKISDMSPNTRGVFEACQLQDLFDFVPDQATAIQQFSQ